MIEYDYLVQADGGSRGNPGTAGYGAVVYAKDGIKIADIAGPLRRATNNVAEYSGLVAALEFVAGINSQAKVHAELDSKLVVEQMSGRWKIKHPDMQELAKKAMAILPVQNVTYKWIPREENSVADKLSNDAMDAAAAGHTKVRVRRYDDVTIRQEQVEAEEKTSPLVMDASLEWESENGALILSIFADQQATGMLKEWLEKVGIQISDRGSVSADQIPIEVNLR